MRAAIVVVSMSAWGCAGTLESVVKDGRGTELRGEVLGGEDACRAGNEHGQCRVRVAGGSILTMPAADVAGISREPRVPRDTGHAGQVGILVSGGIAGGLSAELLTVPVLPEPIEFNALLLGLNVPVSGALTYAVTDVLELQLGYLGAPIGLSVAHHGTFGARYFLLSTDAIKPYAGASVVVGSGVGLHTRAGYQLDFSRHVGAYVETGLVLTYQLRASGRPPVFENAPLRAFVDVQLGLQVRLGR